MRTESHTCMDRDDGIETAHYNLKDTLMLAYGDKERRYLVCHLVITTNDTPVTATKPYPKISVESPKWWSDPDQKHRPGPSLNMT
jgi:hypothetical protein